MDFVGPAGFPEDFGAYSRRAEFVCGLSEFHARVLALWVAGASVGESAERLGVELAVIRTARKDLTRAWEKRPSP